MNPLNVTSHISNLRLFDKNECIIHGSDDTGYWWASIEEIVVKDEYKPGYLVLKVVTDRGPFKIKDGEAVYSNEKAPYIVNAAAYPDIPDIRGFIYSSIRMNEEDRQRRNNAMSYKALYDDLVNKLTGNKGKI